MGYRLAKALVTLRAQINEMSPNRDKESDGWIGNAEHASRNSDHNPWVRHHGEGIVTAIDIDHDPSEGVDGLELRDQLIKSRDKRIKYIIWNRRIANRDPIGGAAAWAWRPYTGSNPHDHHAHISVRPDKALYDSRNPWRL